MRMLELVQVKRNLSELVKRASEGESTGITLRGKVVAIIAPPKPTISLGEVFADIEEIRKHVKPLSGLTTKDLIEEGRK